MKQSVSCKEINGCYPGFPQNSETEVGQLFLKGSSINVLLFAGNTGSVESAVAM